MHAGIPAASQLPQGCLANGCPSLEEIDLSTTGMCCFPMELLHLPCLRVINLTGNQLAEIPDGVSTLIRQGIHLVLIFTDMVLESVQHKGWSVVCFKQQLSHCLKEKEMSTETLDTHNQRSMGRFGFHLVALRCVRRLLWYQCSAL